MKRQPGSTALDSRLRRTDASRFARVEASFLTMEFVERDSWNLLSQSQRDLHLFWTKKLLPLYEDSERVREDDLLEGDRACIRWLLGAVAAHSIRLSGPFRECAFSREFLHFHTTVNLEEGSTTLGVSIGVGAPVEPGPILFHLHNLNRIIDIVMVWRCQDDSERGTVSIYPQAYSSSRRFGFVAFNKRQFEGVCRALVDYISCNRDTGSGSPDMGGFTTEPTPAALPPTLSRLKAIRR